MAAGLPSYREATTRLDWLDLVAPYVRFSDYRALCRVDRRFWAVFAPRLWSNLLRAVRSAGLDPGDDLEWWFDFVFNRLDSVQAETRALVRVLDTRQFAKDAYHFASDQHERTLQQSFRRALEFFPNVHSILLDDHADLDPSFLIGQSQIAEHRPLLLSIANCPSQLPNTYFNSPSMQSLVYLDISGVPGSIWPLIQPGLLRDLRILRVRRRELDDSAISALASIYRLRLWSLDISDNRMTDAVVDVLRKSCFPVTELRSPAFFRVEGKLVTAEGGASQYGPFVSIEESEQSGSFDHLERYYIDPPMYLAESDAGPQEYQAFRSNGRAMIRLDSAEEITKVLLGDNRHLAAHDLQAARGLTHLRLSNNQLSAVGLEKLVRTSNGQLELLACDSVPLLPASKVSAFWPKGATLYGILGASHVFRPVFSSNLRVLRIHHSLVTHIPTLEVESLSSLARLYICETAILPRVKQAYGQTFVPDMNPRLTSLTLTCIPRRSTGPLVARLINFLKLASAQEQLIDEARLAASSRRGPAVLQGLRHLRLEFEPDPLEEDFSMSEDLDAEELMSSGDQGFSFFEDERVGRSPTEVKPAADFKLAANASERDEEQPSGESGRDDDSLFTYKDQWNGSDFSIPVWVGPKAPSPSSSVINDYRRLVLKHGLRDGVGPASPSQVVAAAPEKSYVFHTAWCAAIMPPSLTPPSRSDLAGMRDVLEELKKYRLGTRATYAAMKTQAGHRHVPLGEPHLFWTGTLEVSKAEPMPQRRSSQYWR